MMVVFGDPQRGLEDQTLRCGWSTNSVSPAEKHVPEQASSIHRAESNTKSLDLSPILLAEKVKHLIDCTYRNVLTQQ